MVNLVGDRYGVQLSLNELEKARLQTTQDESRTYEIPDNLHHLGERFVVKNYFQSRWTSHPDIQQRLGCNIVHVSTANA